MAVPVARTHAGRLTYNKLGFPAYRCRKIAFYSLKRKAYLCLRLNQSDPSDSYKFMPGMPKSYAAAVFGYFYG